MQRFSFLSSDGKTTVAAYRTETREARAMVQISHGMCEYFLRYEGFAEYLSEMGILVFGHDHLGHGNTAPNEEALGFTASGGGSEHLIEDVHALSLLMKREHPELPLILFGHSMGSFIARAVLARYGADYQAAVICGTGGPETPAGAGKLLARLLVLFCGERHRSGLLKGIAFSGYTKRCGKGCDPNAWLTRDESIVDKYNADRFCTYTFTLRAYHDLFTLVQEVSRKDWAGKLPPELPLLITGGEEDPVGGFGKGMRTVDARLREAGCRDVTLLLYPQMRHEILNELGKEQVWRELGEWMKTKLS